MKKLIFHSQTGPQDERYKTFSIRLEANIFHQIEQLAKKTRLSRNKIICRYISFGLEHSELENGERMEDGPDDDDLDNDVLDNSDQKDGELDDEEDDD